MNELRRRILEQIETAQSVIDDEQIKSEYRKKSADAIMALIEKEIDKNIQGWRRDASRWRKRYELLEGSES